MKNIYAQLKWHLCHYRAGAMAIVLSLLGFVLLRAIWSFSPTDSSWFYYTTEINPIANGAGLIGAQIAALLFYLFGGSCMLFVPLLFFTTYLLITKQSLSDHWERLVAGVLCIIFYSTLVHVYAVDFLSSPYPGGYVGHYMAQLLYSWLDQFSVLIFLHTALFVSLILLVRFSFMPVVHYMVNGVRFVSSQRFLRPAYYYISSIVWVISRPIVWFYQAVARLCSPETVHNEERSILEFERGIKQAKLQEDAFWQNYMDTPADHMQQNMPDHTDQFNHTMEQKRTPQDVSFFVDHEAPTKESTVEPYGSAQTTRYDLPNLDIFIGNQEEREDSAVVQHLQEQAQMLEQKLERFGVSGKVVAIKRGPVVTLFEYQPEIDSKISKITSLEDDLALALQALSIRIIAPIPGQPFVGFEVSNKRRKDVLLAEVIRSDAFDVFSGHLPLALGQDTIGNNVLVDLARMPHLLIAGSTGSGKSVALNAMLVSLLCKLRPDELRLVLIDPKRLEFAAYADIAHLLFPIVTHPKKAAPVLKWVVQQMEERYEMMAKYGARNVHDFNVIMEKIGQDRLPFIVVIIDELADLMMTAGREIEDLIARITQMARAAGIHLIVATQRPSVDVITGLIKVNFPSRISFRVTSKVDSRTILDCSGADKLLGRGDMLFLDSHDASLKRLHGAYVSDREIMQLVTHIKEQQEVQYLDSEDELQQIAFDEDRDEIYEDVLGYLEGVDEVSISLLQRKFRIGYNRSARIIDMLETEGLISSSGNGKTRSVIR